MFEIQTTNFRLASVSSSPMEMLKLLAKFSKANFGENKLFVVLS